MPGIQDLRIAHVVQRKVRDNPAKSSSLACPKTVICDYHLGASADKNLTATDLMLHVLADDTYDGQ